jgi:hypothetical protein
MTSAFFGGRVPPVLLAKIEKHIEETGESKTKFLINAVCKYLDLPVEDCQEDRIVALENRVALLEDYVQRDRDIETARAVFAFELNQKSRSMTPDESKLIGEMRQSTKFTPSLEYSYD